MILLKLFWSFFQVGLFSIGGGYAAMPLIEEQVVNLNHWLTSGEFVDIITISQMTPGPIALNTATFVGMRVDGVLGAVIATLGCITPSCIIVLILAFLYSKYKNQWGIQGALTGLRPVVVSLIASAGMSIILTAFFTESTKTWLDISLSAFDYAAFGLFGIAFFVLRKFKVSPIYVMLGSGVLGFVFYYLIRP
jgi:chromate transporter